MNTFADFFKANPVTPTRKLPNSQVIRNEIAAAKAEGRDKDSVIEFGMRVLGQSKALATRYVNENWDRPTQLERKAGVAKTSTAKQTGEVKVPKSALVRERIAVAKRNSEAPEVVVQWAMENLGFKLGLAKVYVKENWPKVVV